METFNWGLQSRMAPEQQGHFTACVKDLEAKSVVLREIASDLPVGIEADLALLSEQTAYNKAPSRNFRSGSGPTVKNTRKPTRSWRG